MKTAKSYRNILAGFMAVALALLLGAGVSAITAHAASGNVYTCKVHPCYRHPVTGEIEDAGGEDSYATGQGMVEGCVASTGLMEVTSDGVYYLTIRLGLMDYTSNHSFLVQNAGSTGWSAPAVTATGSGTDSNGTTKDVCIQVPSENGVVRISMYVEPMGRNVIFYVYANNFSEGNSTNMNATMVTSGSGDTSAADTTGSAASGEKQNPAAQNGAGTADTSGNTAAGQDNVASDDGNVSTEQNPAQELESTIEEAAQEAPSVDTGAVDQAQGLVLSTAEDLETEPEVTEKSSISLVKLTVMILVIGCAAICVGVVITQYCNKHGIRKGGAPDDDE